MPLNGSDVASKPSGTTASPNTTIESDKFNSVVDDIYSIFNTTRTVAKGFTGASSAIGALDNFHTKSADIASASTVDLSAATGFLVHITGTTTITAFSSQAAGITRMLVFDGALTLTHNATSFILPGGADITTSAGDSALFMSEGSGNWRCVIYNFAASTYSWTQISTDTGGVSLKDLTEYLGTNDRNTLATGTTIGLTAANTFDGDSGGATDYRNFLSNATLDGAYGVTQVNAQNNQVELTHTAGAVGVAHAVESYIRQGLSGSSTGTTTAANVYDGHIANESDAAMGACTVFKASDVDLNDGTGAIASMHGLTVGNLGHASRVTSEALGVDVGDFTGGATLTASFRSQMTSGTGKWAFYSSGNANSAMAGKLRVGSASAPTDALEVSGFLKASNGGTYLAGGTYHEIVSTNNDAAVRITNTHATTPRGLIISFNNASPDNNSDYFLRCVDSTTDRLYLYSDGDGYNHDGTWGMLSDGTLKTEVSEARPQLADIMSLNFVNYKFKSDVKKHGKKADERFGLIAQDVQKVCPGLVREFQNDDGETKLHLKSSILTLKAVKALQELAKTVDAQAAEIADLRARLDG